MTVCKASFFSSEIPIKFRGVLYEQNNRKKSIKYKHTVDTAVNPMYMVDILLVILLFIFSD